MAPKQTLVGSFATGLLADPYVWLVIAIVIIAGGIMGFFSILIPIFVPVFVLAIILHLIFSKLIVVIPKSDRKPS